MSYLLEIILVIFKNFGMSPLIEFENFWKLSGLFLFLSFFSFFVEVVKNQAFYRMHVVRRCTTCSCHRLPSPVSFGESIISRIQASFYLLPLEN